MSPTLNRRLRRLHLYAGVFFAPAILLFAVSGMLQTFRWQEEKGYGGTPPQWIAWIASVHMNQAPPREKAKRTQEKAGVAAEGSARAKQAPAQPPRGSALPLKTFVGVMGLGLTLSALLGIALALANRATRRLSLAMIVAGTALPLALLLG